MNRVYQSVYIFLILFSMLFISCDLKDTKFKKINLSGQFVMVGNEPFTKLVFKTTDGKIYEIDAKEKQFFVKKQGVKTNIEGFYQTVTMETADGKYKRNLNIIKNIKILK